MQYKISNNKKKDMQYGFHWMDAQGKKNQKFPHSYERTRKQVKAMTSMV